MALPGDSGQTRYPRIARLCGAGVIIIGISGLLGWIFNIPELNSIIPGYKPIAISAAIVFILLGTAQLVIAGPHISRISSTICFGITIFVTLFGLLETLQLLTGLPVSLEDAILRHYPTLFANPNTQISPVAGLLAFLIGLAQSLYLYQWASKQRVRVLEHVIGVLGSLVILISTEFLLSYIYRTPLLYSTVYIPIAALAALAALLSGIGIITTIGDTTLPLSWFSGPSTRARLLRTFLPLTALLMLSLSIVQYLLTRFTSTKPAIVAPVIVIFFEIIITVVILQQARAVGGLIDRAEEERRRAQEALQRMNESLEQRVSERTADLEASNKELEGFTYSVAHDLRTPLRSVAGFSEYVLKHYADRLDEQGQNYLQRMRTAAQRMGRLIDDLLELARIGRVNMKIEPVNLSDLSAEIVAGLRRRDPARTVEVDIMPDMVAPADRDLLRAALAHLLDNAWKFTGTRPVAHISVGYIHKHEQPVYFVRDNGVGFDPAYIDKLFYPFQRLHSEIDFPGTGIGLAMVQRIIQRHNGRVWAEGVEGQGATFYFTLAKEE